MQILSWIQRLSVGAYANAVFCERRQWVPGGVQCMKLQ